MGILWLEETETGEDMKPAVRRCAIYTRKSSEKGLEQDFNTLDAQKEACHAYITSQKAEGWIAVDEHYDDGGFSGGNMERPALKKLMDDIQAGKIHIIVVYKIDRLTRSLMDFAKLVGEFDKHGVTFVSITQSFNTTTSMGRLTLNVLLSFAQFEREVTGERIRDKIAASKKKGMWMGGPTPLGYEVKNRSLVIHEEDAILAKKIFQAYLESGSVLNLKGCLDREGYKTKTGNFFSRGGLYGILTSHIYIGKVRHKDQIYDGQHPALISEETWTAVQKMLEEYPVMRGQKKMSQDFLLQGILYDEKGIIYTPVFTTKNRQQYRYYVSRDKLEARETSENYHRRIPAQEIENFVEKTLRDNIEDSCKLSEILTIDHSLHYKTLECFASKGASVSIEEIIKKSVRKITLRNDSLTIDISPAALLSIIQEEGEQNSHSPQEIYHVTAAFQMRSGFKGAVVIRPPATDALEDIFSLPPHKLRNLVQGIIWRDEHFNGMTISAIAHRECHTDGFIGRLIRNTLEIA
jgi:site-specific DNA recombinase